MAKVAAIDSVRFAVVSDVTVRLLAALVAVARATTAVDTVLITSGSDGPHSGPSDPHHFGRALDVRTHNFPDHAARLAFVELLQTELGVKFFVELEDPGLDNEHVHVQLRRFEDYP